MIVLVLAVPAPAAFADAPEHNAPPALYIGPPTEPPVPTAAVPSGADAAAPALSGGSDTPALPDAEEPVGDDATVTIHRGWGNHPASPAASTASDHTRAVDCMTMAIAYEAGSEPVAGQQAVAQVILNRMRIPRFPKSVCGVVFDGSSRATGCQFTFTCDGSIRRQLRDETLLVARGIAESVLSGGVPDRVGGATHYHADYVLPYWASTGTRVVKIGAHIFYRMPGDAAHFGRQLLLDGPEPDIAALRAGHDPRRWPAPARGPAIAAVNGGGSLFAPWGLPIAGLAQR